MKKWSREKNRKKFWRLKNEKERERWIKKDKKERHLKGEREGECRIKRKNNSEQKGNERVKECDGQKKERKRERGKERERFEIRKMLHKTWLAYSILRTQGSWSYTHIALLKILI